METKQSENRVITRFSNTQIAYLIILFVAGILLRTIGLDTRPVHHDESLHLMYGRYFFDWPDQQYYKYSAMLHGPLLYNALRAVYDTLGSSTWSGRAFTALLGIFLMFTPLFFRRFFSTWALLALSTAFALSPTLIYWSRFIREDAIQMALMAVTVIGAIYSKGAMKSYVVMLGVVLQFCEKENSFVSLALLLGYVVYELFLVAFGLTERTLKFNQTLAGRFLSYCRQFFPHLILSLLIGALIYCYFYSAGFRYPQGILDGLYRESIAYWFNQHSIQRIPGPFLFHFYTLNWYESIFIGLVFLNLILFYLRAGTKILVFGIVTLSFASLVTFFEINRFGKTIPVFEQLQPWKFFHLKRPIEILSLFIFLIQPVVCLMVHLFKKERAEAFWGYFFWASFFTYSYLGEKVPWLSVYVLLPGLIYLALYFDRCVSSKSYENLQSIPLASFLRWTGVLICLVGLVFVFESKDDVETWSGNNALTLMAGVCMICLAYLDSWIKIFGNFNFLKLLVVISIAYTVRHAYMTNFTHAGSDVEYLSQVHTSKRFHKFILDVRHRAEYPSASGVKPTILAEGDSVWPVTWYLIDIPEYKFSATAEERKNFNYLFIDHKPGEAVPDGFCSEVLPLRSWFVPDFDSMNFKSYLIYMFNRRPWSTTGSSNITALVKNPDWQNCPRIIANGP